MDFWEAAARSPGEPAGDAAEVSQGTEPASRGASLPFSSSTAASSTSSISSWLLAAISALVIATKDGSRARASRPPEIRACSRGRGHTRCLCPAPIPPRATSSPPPAPFPPRQLCLSPPSPCLTSWMRKVMAGVEEVLGTPLSSRCCSEDGWVRGAESSGSASGSAHGKPLPRKCEGCRDHPQPVHAIPSLWSPRASPPLPHTVPVTSWGRRCCPDAGRCPEAAPRLLLGLCCSLSEGKGRSQPRRRRGGDIGGAQGQDHDSHPEGTGWERVI